LNAIQALYQLSYSPEVSGLRWSPPEEARNLVRQGSLIKPAERIFSAG